MSSCDLEAGPDEALGSSGLPFFAAQPDWTYEGPGTGGRLGVPIAGGGDVNGDGYGDLLVGLEGPGNQGNGPLRVFHGSASGLATSPDWERYGGAKFGAAATSLGDLDLDGFDDVAVGAPRESDLRGEVTVFRGSPDGLEESPSWDFQGLSETANFGYAVADAGDVNGDGRHDLLVGSNSYDGKVENVGRVDLFMAQESTLLSLLPDWSVVGEQAGMYSGMTVAGIGDVNGDGFGDLAHGTLGWDGVVEQQGRVDVHHGSATGPSAVADLTIEGPGPQFGFPSRRFGLAGGDLNGDNYDDLVVGVPLYDTPPDGQGAVFVYLGSATGLAGSPDITIEGGVDSEFFGIAVSVGDLNGDGYADILVGDHQTDAPALDSGRAFLFMGSQTGVAVTEAWSGTAGAGEAAFGGAVAIVEDIDGDGFREIAVGAAYHDVNSEDEGAVFVWFGCSDGDGDGVPDFPDCGAQGDDDDVADDDDVVADDDDDDIADDDDVADDDDIADDDDVADDDDAADDDDGCTDCDGDGYSAEVDCDDESSAVHPGAEEVEDGLDNDCDGRVDSLSGEGCDGCGNEQGSLAFLVPLLLAIPRRSRVLL